MSYNAGLVTSNAFALLTGAKSQTNATPDTVEPAGTGWITVPAGATDGVAFTGAVLMRGILSSTAAYWEQACFYVPTSDANRNWTGEMSDDELCFYRSSGATINVEMLERISSYSPLFESTLPRFCVWRMS
jgi:hypothetical protein